MFDLTPKFNLMLAQQLAVAAAQAYGVIPFSTDEPMPEWIQLADAHCFIQDFGTCLLISIRGTADIKDVITDVRFVKMLLADSFPNVRVHRGFYDTSRFLASVLITRLSGNAKPIIICGHSLGGAQAVHIARLLHKSGQRIALVYTYGKPRVGNAEWKQSYNAILGPVTFHVRCAGDLVPLVPGMFCPPLDGYRHEGNEIFVTAATQGDASKAYWRLNPNRLIEIAADEWLTFKALERGDLQFIAQFHSIQKDYMGLLEKCLN